MKRILAFCGRDWQDPRAGFVEGYVHEVLRRLAAQGHYVVWVCHSYRIRKGSGGNGRDATRNSPLESARAEDRGRVRRAQAWWPWRGAKPPSLETVDGIQMARLGARVLYRTMSGMFLTRLRNRMKTVPPFDVVLDCITKRPLELANGIDAPVVPLVFDIAERVRADERPPGPIIAASAAARQALLRSGVPENFIVTAPYGTEAPAAPGERAGKPLLAVTGGFGRFGVLAKALARLKREGIDVSVQPGGLGVPDSRSISPEVLQRTWLGYCAPGTEQAALEMGAAGVPVVCIASSAACEYVEDGVTGLLVSKTPDALADAVRRLIADDALRARMAAAARDRACAQSWDTTASLVLATIENLRIEQDPGQVPPVRTPETPAKNALKSE